MDTSCGDSTEKSKFEKADSFAFKKFKTFIILCGLLAIAASEAAAMTAEQAQENHQVWEDSRQNRGESDSEVTSELPINLRVPANMRPTLKRMLRNSATFRRQIATLRAKPSVRVSVAYGGMRGERNYHALSTVRKHEWGAMVVDTMVYVPADLVEIIAHELEHVCEQMEGVDLRSLSRLKGEGVYDLNGHFETNRAIRAGREATREYHQDGPDVSQQQTLTAPYY